ncbi:MAG: amidohydrolase [candidate division Zixibacteria bacterium]|nr:amidohydrolase [candidate division Zixibacteria bacterium]
MTTRSLISNARIYTMADGIIVNSMVVERGRVVAVGNQLEGVDCFRKHKRIDLGGRTVVPGFVDAHTHFVYFAMSLGRVWLQEFDTLDACLKEIKRSCHKLGKNDWVVGEGYLPDRFRQKVEPDRLMLDKVTGGRPAFIYSKDGHTAWVNSKALELAGISKQTRDPDGGEIVRLADGSPSGILREGPAYNSVFKLIKRPSTAHINRCYREALQIAYRKGVTGVHCFDGPESFGYLMKLAESGQVGLRMEYYPAASLLPKLHITATKYGTGTEFFRIAGVKLFSDGSLGSQSALCFNKYKGNQNVGIEVLSSKEILRIARSAARLGLPCAVHAIGDRAVANVLDGLEKAPALRSPARHRIEHLQLVRRKDIPRLKKANIMASMQPSHLPSDIDMMRKYWGSRGANTFVFRTLLDKGIDLAFGSDVPIEPLDPIAGIAAAVRRAQPGKRDVFYPEERISATEALHGFTVGPAIAAGQEHCRGQLMPGYPADFVVLSDDITRIAPSRIRNVKVLATVLDGKVKYRDQSVDI